MAWILKLLVKLGVIKPIMLKINKLGIHHHLIDGDTDVDSKFRQIMNLALPGDFVLIRAFGEVTTELQEITGGEDCMTHTAIKTHTKDCIVDATSIGVKKRDILKLNCGICKIALRRPKLSLEQRNAIAYRAEFYATQDIPYDFDFGIVTSEKTKDEKTTFSDKKEMYCSELGYFCFNDVVPGRLKLIDIDGIKTISPQNLYDDNANFESIITIEALSH